MEQEQINLKEINEELKDMKKRIERLTSIIENLDFSKETEKAWKEIEAGKGKTQTKEEFLKEIENW